MKNLIFFIQNHYFTDISIFFANSMLNLEKGNKKDRGDSEEGSWKSHEKIIVDLSEKEKILYLTYLLVSQNHELGNLSFDLDKWSAKKLICKEEALLLPSKKEWLNIIPNKMIGVVQISSDKQDIPYKPLLLFKDKVYLQKNFIYQKIIIESILERKASSSFFLQNPQFKKNHVLLFSDFSEKKSNNNGQANIDKESIDWQSYAAFLALVYPFMILSGGPGTGKTTTVFKILILLLTSLVNESGKEFNIQLVAPTGKAVKRLQESVLSCCHDLRECIEKISLSASIDLQKYFNEISQRTMTVHRFLSFVLNKNLSETKHSYQQIDVLVIDESTMISLEILAYLFNVLKPSCRIVFLGDKDQLSSIGETSLLSYLLQDCSLSKNWETVQSSFVFKMYRQFLEIDNLSTLPLEQKFKTVNQFIDERTVVLQKNYRLSQKDDVEFYELILADFYREIISKDPIKEEKDLQKLNDLLDKTHISSRDLQLKEGLLSRSDFLWFEEISEKGILAIIEVFFLPLYREYFTLANQFQSLAGEKKTLAQRELFSFLNKIVILTITNQGGQSGFNKNNWGVHKLNELLENYFSKSGLIHFSEANHYPGQIILITENNYQQKLYNGDLGIALYNEEGKIQFFFEKNNFEEKQIHEFQNIEMNQQVANRDEHYVGYYPYELRKWQVGFTMTVHKSQGSEYENVVFVLPEESAEFCDKSLIYTALSRTQKRCISFFKKDVFLEAVSRIDQKEKGRELQDYLEEVLF